MSARTRITARGVRMRLTCAGIDLGGQLVIEDHTELSRIIDFDYVGPWRRENEVRITGPKALRREARDLLFWNVGYACAPYPDRDCYTTPRQDAPGEWE